jgi:hypothetical protein
VKVVVQDTQFRLVHACYVSVAPGETFDEKAVRAQCIAQKGTDDFIGEWHTGPMDGGTVYVNLLAARMP